MGHSLGGATSGATMLINSHFIAGLNFDGAMIGPVVTQGLEKPFLLFAAEAHNRTNDKTWATFWDKWFKDGDGEVWMDQVRNTLRLRFRIDGD